MHYAANLIGSVLNKYLTRFETFTALHGVHSRSYRWRVWLNLFFYHVAWLLCLLKSGVWGEEANFCIRACLLLKSATSSNTDTISSSPIGKARFSGAHFAVAAC
jgi:hypothetical protein